MTQSLPAATSRVDEEVAARIVRLDLKGFTQAEIARQVQVHRRTVRRVLERTRAASALTQDLALERARSIAVLLEVQREAWDSVSDLRQQGKSPAGLLAVIQQAQVRIDTLRGLDTLPAIEPARQTINVVGPEILDMIHAFLAEPGEDIAPYQASDPLYSEGWSAQ